MINYKTIQDLQLHLQKLRVQNLKIGFVPTMGALHNGHISLIENSKQNNAITVCSIFVNPTQFNNKSDFEKYPITIDKDVNLLEEIGCDVLFLPTVDEIYPNGTEATQTYNLGFVETVLDGKYRPGHFQGVCKVVHRLLNIVNPDNLYLGQKDYQQCMVITKLVQLTNHKVKINICHTLREIEGLAMSSRNMRLSEQEKLKALRIFETLLFLKKEIKPGNLNDLKDRCISYLTSEGFKVDYVEIASAETLELLDDWDGKQNIVALIAAFLGEVRLIDNMLIC